MSDSIDRVFVHALNTVKRIPRTGSARPPSSDRLRLYGLYKQSMEGDVEGVMKRPVVSRDDGGDEAGTGEDRGEVEKWDAWSAQHGLSRTAAKRAYISTLIDTMHKYASSTPEARELVAELEFVWDQVKANSDASGSRNSSGQSYGRGEEERLRDDGLRILKPASEEDGEEEEKEYVDAGLDERLEGNAAPGATKRESLDSAQWRRRIESSLVKITAEIAALREQMEAKRVFPLHGGKKRGMGAWMLWLVWVTIRHFLVDAVVVACVMLWIRKGNEWGLVRRWLEGWREVWRGVVGRLKRRRELGR